MCQDDPGGSSDPSSVCCSKPDDGDLVCSDDDQVEYGFFWDGDVGHCRRARRCQKQNLMMKDEKKNFYADVDSCMWACSPISEQEEEDLPVMNNPVTSTRHKVQYEVYNRDQIDQICQQRGTKMAPTCRTRLLRYRFNQDQMRCDPTWECHGDPEESFATVADCEETCLRHYSNVF
jgi:hypothetical protein